MNHTKITKKERELIGQWKLEKTANKEIARRLGRPVLTIRRELKRNKTRVAIGNDWEMIYEPLHAQVVAEERKRNAWLAKEPLKNKKVFSYVMKHLKYGWSPEQIAGRLRYEYSDDPTMHISMETIYQFIYKVKTDQTRKGQLTEIDGRKKRKEMMVTVTDHTKPLWEYLRRKQVRRRTKGGRKSQRVRIPDRVSIHDRPVIVAKRTEFGHWEGDSIVGRGHTSGLHTEYERVASMIRFERLRRISSDQVVLAITKIFDDYPSHAKRSTTVDNGLEHVKHAQFGLPVFFADPYSAWQRGGNENANLWIRYYFPKGTDFSTITDEELKDVEWELNNRPRKRLNFKTPQEVFTQYLTLT